MKALQEVILNQTGPQDHGKRCRRLADDPTNERIAAADRPQIHRNGRTRHRRHRQAGTDLHRLGARRFQGDETLLLRRRDQPGGSDLDIATEGPAGIADQTRLDPGHHRAQANPGRHRHRQTQDQ